MTEAANGFLGRWAQRKNDALLGKPLVEPAAPATPAPLAVTTPVVRGSSDEMPVPEAVPVDEPSPALSLDDVKLLTKDSDFKPFMAQNVAPQVRNAAMKKLFEDPHFNIMDGLDIYIDDYSISEPIPESMLRQMASAKFLNLFEEEKDDNIAAIDPQERRPDVADLTEDTPDASADGVAGSSLNDPPEPRLDSAATGIDPPSQPELLSTFVASQENHDDSYLRLQPDHAPSSSKAGRGS